MNPRLKTSKKWTALPTEYLTQVEEAFRESFPSQLKETAGAGKAKVIVEGRIYSEEILLRVGILEKGRLKQANFEVSMSFSAKKKDAIERLHDSIDAAASMMSEYFNLKEDEEPDFPLLWKEYEFNGLPLFLQFSTVNSSLESQADALLGTSTSSLVVEDGKQPSEDAMEAAEVLSTPLEPAQGLGEGSEESSEEDLAEPFFEPLAGPSLLGGTKKKPVKKKKSLH